MPDRSGQQFGNYRLVRLLGQGGFADVYLGEHLYLETQAAIKVLHIQIGSSEQESFQKEAKTLAHLVHPHIVRVLEFGMEERTPFLVMDYAVNGTVRQCYPKGSILPLPTIVSYVQQVAEALHYAHEQRLIHRDIKPENMLLGASRQILLSDFGLATLTQNSSLLMTQDKIGAGTAPYTAPEQIQGKPRTASDQYALGIVVYEWLTGVRPFQGEPLALYYQHLHAVPASLQERVPGISPLLEQVVMTALAKEPTERFASVQAFANALTQTVQVKQVFPLTPHASTVLNQTSEQEQYPVPKQPLSALLPTRLSLPSELITQPPQDPTFLEEERARGKPIPDNNHKKGSISRRASKSKVILLSVLTVLVVLALAGGIVWLRPPRTSVVGTIPTPTGTIPTHVPTATPSPTPTQTTPSPTPTATLSPQPPTSVMLSVSASGISPTTQSELTIPSGTKVTLTVQPNYSLLPFQTYTMGIYATDPYGFSELQYCQYPNTATCSWIVAYSSSENTDYTKGKHTFIAFLGDIGGRTLANSNSVTITWS